LSQPPFRNILRWVIGDFGCNIKQQTIAVNFIPFSRIGKFNNTINATILYCISLEVLHPTNKKLDCMRQKENNAHKITILTKTKTT
jgi:hypothetical protein